MSIYPSHDARQLAILLRISDDIDFIGDLNVTVANPPELLAWVEHLHETKRILAWRALDSRRRYLHLEAHHHGSPIRGQITLTLDGDHHHDYWHALLPADLTPGTEQELTLHDITRAWNDMPITPNDATQAPKPPI